VRVALVIGTRPQIIKSECFRVLNRWFRSVVMLAGFSSNFRVRNTWKR